MIDNATLMIAIAFSSGALFLTLLVSWLNSTRDNYLISWALGMGFVVVALATLGLQNGRYDLWVQTGPFSALITGMAFILLGAGQFRSGKSPFLRVGALWIAALVGTNVPLLLGYSGTGTIALNLSCTMFMVLGGYQYWAARAEAPLVLAANAILYWLVGLSFLACAAVLTSEGQSILYGPPSNWAEALNSIMAIVGLTGVGALSLNLNQSRATRRHRQEALTDSLTGLLNRRALFDRFGQTHLPEGTAVLMFDIDHFKQINDRHGHAGGDTVIVHFAAIVRQSARSEDIFARIGGEEFSAILKPMPIDQAKAIAEKIRSDFESTPAHLGAEVIAATISIGLATTGTGESFSSVMKRADDALYKAKGSGRNRVTTAPFRLIA